MGTAVDINVDYGYLLNNNAPILGWYVYGWVNADWGGVYFYIGKGHGNRYKETKNRGKAFKAINQNWSCFPVILADGLTEEEAELQEAEFKQRMIFDMGFPIMDGEGHSSTLKHLAAQRAKRELRKNNPQWKEGRPRRKIPENFADYVHRNAAGAVSVRQACKEMNISTSQWYKWQREAEVMS